VPWASQAILAADSCIHDGFVGFRDLDPRVKPIFLYYWLLSEQKRHKSQAPGAIWVNLTTDQVRAFLIPLPPLELQDRFAAHVSRVKALQEAQQEQLTAVEGLLRSLQYQFFSASCDTTSRQQFAGKRPCHSLSFLSGRSRSLRARSTGRVFSAYRRTSRLLLLTAGARSGS